MSQAAALPAHTQTKLAPVRKRAWVTLLGVTVLIPLSIAGAMLASAGPKALVGAALSALLCLALAALLFWAFGRTRLEFDGRTLCITATFYRQQVALADIAPGKARIVSLDEHPDLRPRWKTNGFALPGFSAGYFRLANGSKAFCLITDPARVLALTRNDGSMLLLSPERPQALLDRLRAPHAV